MPPKLKLLLEHSDYMNLIEEVRRRPFLWHPMNRKQTVHNTHAAWKEIAETLDMNVTHCKLKWKNFRDTFRRIARNPKASSLPPHKRWRYFDKLSFLLEVMNIPVETNDSNEEEEYPDDNLETMDTDGALDFKSEIVDLEQEVEVLYQAPFDTTDDFDKLDPSFKPGPDDFNEMFLKSLLPFFNQLDPMRNLIARNKIQTILIDELSAQQTSKGKDSNK